MHNPSIEFLASISNIEAAINNEIFTSNNLFVSYSTLDTPILYIKNFVSSASLFADYFIYRFNLQAKEERVKGISQPRFTFSAESKGVWVNLCFAITFDFNAEHDLLALDRLITNNIESAWMYVLNAEYLRNFRSNVFCLNPNRSDFEFNFQLLSSLMEMDIEARNY